MKDFILFWREANFTIKLTILKYIFVIPAVLFHEACHILMVFLTFQKLIYVKCLYFFKVEKTKSGTTLRFFSVQVCQRSRTRIGIVLVSAAPLIGIVLSPLISFYLFFYLLLAYNGSFLSAQDYSNIKNSLKPNQIRLSKVLNKIEKIVVPDYKKN